MMGLGTVTMPVFIDNFMSDLRIDAAYGGKRAVRRYQPSGKRYPAQSQREIARRRRQIAAGQLPVTPLPIPTQSPGKAFNRAGRKRGDIA